MFFFSGFPASKANIQDFFVEKYINLSFGAGVTVPKNVTFSYHSLLDMWSIQAK